MTSSLTAEKALATPTDVGTDREVIVDAFDMDREDCDAGDLESKAGINAPHRVGRQVYEFVDLDRLRDVLQRLSSHRPEPQSWLIELSIDRPGYREPTGLRKRLDARCDRTR